MLNIRYLGLHNTLVLEYLGYPIVQPVISVIMYTILYKFKSLTNYKILNFLSKNAALHVYLCIIANSMFAVMNLFALLQNVL